MIPIHFQILNSSHCRALKNPDHWDILWNILSYNTIFSHGGKVHRTKASGFNKGAGKGWFGLGLYRYVIEELKKLNIPYKYELKCEPIKLITKPDIVFRDSIVPEEYQKKAIKVLDKGIKRGIFEAPTGAGKTFIEVSIIKKFGIPNTLIITPNKSIFEQTISSLSHFLGRDVGALGSGRKDWKKVSVCLYQTLRRMDLSELNNYVDLILVDEAHLAIDIINELLSNFTKVWYKYGLTGTPIPKNKKKEWFIVTSQLGEVIYKVTEKQAEKRIINDVQTYMFYFFTEPKELSYPGIYRNDVLRNEKRCELLLEMVEFGFKEIKVKNCLLLVDEYEQAQIIQFLSEEYKERYMHPIIAWRGEDNEKIKRDFIAGKIPFCIATPVFSVGTDIPNIEHICIGSARKSRSNLRQKLGRGRRKIEGKNTLLVTDIFDDIGINDKFFYKYSRSRMSFYKLKKWFQGIYIKENGEWIEKDLKND